MAKIISFRTRQVLADLPTESNCYGFSEIERTEIFQMQISSEFTNVYILARGQIDANRIVKLIVKTFLTNFKSA